MEKEELIKQFRKLSEQLDCVVVFGLAKDKIGIFMKAVPEEKGESDDYAIEISNIIKQAMQEDIIAKATILTAALLHLEKNREDLVGFLGCLAKLKGYGKK